MRLSCATATTELQNTNNQLIKATTIYNWQGFSNLFKHTIDIRENHVYLNMIKPVL